METLTARRKHNVLEQTVSGLVGDSGESGIFDPSGVTANRAAGIPLDTDQPAHEPPSGERSALPCFHDPYMIGPMVIVPVETDQITGGRPRNFIAVFMCPTDEGFNAGPTA